MDEITREEMDEHAKQYGQIVAKAWADEDFKARFLSDPAAVLQDYGIPTPPGVELRAVENTDKVVYLALPLQPSDELSDEQLSQMSGGSTASTASTTGTVSSFCLTVACIGSLGCSGSV